jgi:hypothetical protein
MRYGLVPVQSTSVQPSAGSPRTTTSGVGNGVCSRWARGFLTFISVHTAIAAPSDLALTGTSRWVAGRRCRRSTGPARSNRFLNSLPSIDRATGPRLWAETETFREGRGVRDIETIDAELRLLVRAWRVARVLNDRTPSTAHIDELLVERAKRDRAPRARRCRCQCRGSGRHRRVIRPGRIC